MTTLVDLPLDVLRRIVAHTFSPPPDLAQLRLVSRAFNHAARTLAYNQVSLSSSAQLNRFLASTSFSHLTKTGPTRTPSPGLPGPPRCLTLARGGQTRPASHVTGRGKAKRTEMVQVEDSITEDELLRVITAVGTGLDELRLVELDFASLRRRQLGFVGHLAGLTALSVTGRESVGFNLHTLGQILTATPNLATLALDNISIHASALSGLPPPTFRLTSLTLKRAPHFTRKQLKWLLRPSSFAESLRQLALTWDGSAGPALNGVRYAALRVTRLVLSTSTPGLVESAALHFPSLERLEVRAACRVDAGRLFGNLERPLVELVDRSGEGAGVGRRGLGWVVATGDLESVRGLRRAVLSGGGGEGMEMVRVACQAKGVELVVEEREAQCNKC